MDTGKNRNPLIKQIPNMITGMRIIGTIVLLFTESFNEWFYTIYTFYTQF